MIWLSNLKKWATDTHSNMDAEGKKPDTKEHILNISVD
jgi:hypothetical protein